MIPVFCEKCGVYFGHADLWKIVRNPHPMVKLSFSHHGETETEMVSRVFLCEVAEAFSGAESRIVTFQTKNNEESRHQAG